MVEGIVEKWRWPTCLPAHCGKNWKPQENHLLGFEGHCSLSGVAAEHWLIIELMESIQSMLWLQGGKIEGFPCYWMLRVWRWVKRDIKLPWDTCPPNKKPQPERVYGTLSWREVEVRAASSSAGFPGLKLNQGSPAESTHHLYEGQSDDGEPTSHCIQVKIWSADMSNSICQQHLTEKQNYPTKKVIHLLILKVWAATQVDSSLSLSHPLEGHKHKRQERQGGERWRGRWLHPIVPFIAPTQRVRIENLPEMKVRS